MRRCVHERSLDKRSLSGSQRVCLQLGESTHQATDRQCNGYSLYKKEGRHSLQDSLIFIPLNLVVVFREEFINLCRTYSWGTELFGRFSIQERPGIQRLDVEWSDFQDLVREVGTIRRRPIRNTQLTSFFSDPEAQASDAMDLLCFSPLALLGRVLQKIRQERVESVTLIAPNWPTQVWYPAILQLLTTDNQPPQESFRGTTSFRSPWFPQSNRLESRDGFKDISADASNLICSAWRRGTEKSYTVAWRKWCSWCQGRNINPLAASLREVIEFITSGFKAGLQYSTLNSIRSALSDTLPPIEGVPVGQHPLVVRLLQGIFNESPRYLSTVVLGMLT